MQRLILFSLLLFIFQDVSSQSIDSVKVAHCKYSYFPTIEYGYVVDSFDTQHLLRNSWIYDSLWQPSLRNIYTYSISGKLVHETNEEKRDNIWELRREIFNSYDSLDSLVENKLFSYWYTFGALSSTFGRQETIVRDTVQEKITTITFDYIDSTASWDTSFFYVSIYDSLNRIIQQDFYYRDVSGNFQMSSMIEFYYLANGLLDYKIDSTSNFIDKYQYFYYPFGHLFQLIQNSWNYQAQQWDPRIIEEWYYDSSYNVIAYSNNLLIDSFLSILDTGTYQYDFYNNQVAYWFQSNTGGGNEGSYIFDSVQILAHSHACIWNHGNGLNCKDCDYTYFKGPFNQEIAENQLNTLNIYPNPAELFFTVSGNWDNENILIEIYNILGDEIECSFNKISQGYQVDISAFNPGLYFVSVTNKKGNSIQKLVVH